MTNHVLKNMREQLAEEFDIEYCEICNKNKPVCITVIDGNQKAICNDCYKKMKGGK